ncbi:MAG: biopolymer transporter ExbD [Oceanisphaera sp.]|nr:biopolymer transporter ExbD [Oceanisphaera sp.]
MNFRRQKLEDVTVNLTPLIDVVFLLLIFFMVSTTFTKENRINLELPQAKGEPASAEQQTLEVIIDAQGRYSIASKPLVSSSLDSLMVALKTLSDGDTSHGIIITADAKAPHQSVITAMDAAGQVGFASLSLTTREPTQTDD